MLLLLFGVVVAVRCDNGNDGCSDSCFVAVLACNFMQNASMWNC